MQVAARRSGDRQAALLKRSLRYIISYFWVTDRYICPVRFVKIGLGFLIEVIFYNTILLNLCMAVCENSGAYGGAGEVLA